MSIKFSVDQFKPMKAVYSYLFPEVYKCLEEAHGLMSRELFKVSTTAKRAEELLGNLVDPPLTIPATADGYLDLDLIHQPVIARMLEAYRAQVPALAGFPWQYPGDGSSNGLFHLLCHLKHSHAVDCINVLSGEYEGYAAQAGNLGMQCKEWSFEDLNKPDSIAAGWWFISNPSARSGNILDNSLINGLCQAGHRVLLDLAYVGATKPYQFDVSHENVFAVVMSFSKPYGVFRFRAGGFIFARQEVKSLYGSRWFKDIERLLQSARLAVKIGPSGLYTKYRPVQEAIVAAINEKFAFAFAPADSLLIANMNASSTVRTLTGEQMAMLAPFKRGKWYRLCLTPYFEDAETQGLI